MHIFSCSLPYIYLANALPLMHALRNMTPDHQLRIASVASGIA